MSQPGLNRGLILELLDKLRNPGKGAAVGEIEDEEPEVSGPCLDDKSTGRSPPLLRLLPCLGCPLVASLRRRKAREHGGLGTELGAQRLRESRGLQTGLLEAGGPDAAAALPSYPPPSLGGSDPPIDPALWGSQLRTAVVSRESLSFGDPCNPLIRLPETPEILLTSKQTLRGPPLPSDPTRGPREPHLQNDSRDPYLSALHTDPIRFPITTRTPRDLRKLVLIPDTQVESKNKHSIAILSPHLPDHKS